MSRNIAIKDALYERLDQEKGDSSFSSVIESYIEKAESCEVGEEQESQEEE